MARRLLIVLLAHGMLRSISLPGELSLQNSESHRSLATTHTHPAMHAANNDAVAALPTGNGSANSTAVEQAAPCPQPQLNRKIGVLLAPFGGEADQKAVLTWVEVAIATPDPAGLPAFPRADADGTFNWYTAAKLFKAVNNSAVANELG